MSFEASCEQGDEKRADAKENSQQIQHGASLASIHIRNEHVGARIQSAAAQPKQDCSHARSRKGMSGPEGYHGGGNKHGRYTQVGFVSETVDKRSNQQRGAKNAEIEQQDQIALLCQIDVQAGAHLGQAKDSPEDCENDTEDKDSATRADEEGSRPQGLTHELSLQRAFVCFVHSIVVIRRDSRNIGRHKYRWIVTLGSKLRSYLCDDGHRDRDGRNRGSSSHGSLPAIHRDQCIFGWHAVINHIISNVSQFLSRGMRGLTLSVIVHGGNRRRRQAALLRFLEYFDARGIQSAVRKHQHHIAAANGLIFEKYRSIAFPAFQPEQSLCASGANNIGPHQPHIHERTESGECAVAWEHVLHRQDRMAAAEQVDQSPTRNAVRHHCRHFLDGCSLGVPDAIQNFANSLAIGENTHGSPPEKMKDEGFMQPTRLKNQSCKFVRSLPGFLFSAPDFFLQVEFSSRSQSRGYQRQAAPELD